MDTFRRFTEDFLPSLLSVSSEKEALKSEIERLREAQYSSEKEKLAFLKEKQRLLEEIQSLKIPKQTHREKELEILLAKANEDLASAHRELADTKEKLNEAQRQVEEAKCALSKAHEEAEQQRTAAQAAVAARENLESRLVRLRLLLQLFYHL